MRYNKSKKILIFLCLFVGIGALIGSTGMFMDPTGKLTKMNEMLPYFKVLPFSNVLFTNYIFSGISLLIVNGLTNLTATYYLINNKKIGIILGTIFGVTLMLWITIQFIIFPPNIMSIAFFVIGLLQTIIGYMTYVFYTQENFKINENNYKNIGQNKETLVVYFSRMGYTKQIALETANKEQADILELKTTEKTENTKGFWWCGRYGMHKWNMKLKPINKNLKEYKKIIIVSPIWVFSICSPIRTFCTEYKNDIKNPEYILTHFMKSTFKNVANELDKILNKKRTKLTSICIRMGKIKYKKVIK